MKQCRKYDLVCRVMRFFTFVDLPIRKKFRLFSFGVLFWILLWVIASTGFVLFWFLVMAALTVVGMVGISVRYERIVNHAVPQGKVVQKVIRNLQAMTIDASNMLKAEERGAVERLRDLSSKRLRDMREFTAALALGGEINDYSHDSGKLLETLQTTSLSGDPQGVAYLREISALLDEIDISYNVFYGAKIKALGQDAPVSKPLTERFAALEEQVQRASQISVDFSSRLAELYHASASKISEIIDVTLKAIVAILLIACLLLLIFTRWISQSISRPIKAITDQIHDVGTGDVDLTKKIEITSRDEIGVLSQEFNGLMDTVYSMTMFKRVIEEDATLDDVYARLGEVFQRQLGLFDFVIYEVRDNQREMVPVFPLTVARQGLPCSQDIMSNCELCRARKTGHEISSLAYPQICRQFRSEDGKVHICIPMIVGGRTGGVVQFLFEPGVDGAPIDTQDVQGRIFKAETYIKQSLSVIEAKRLMNTLRDSALKDPLTGLFNRRFLQDQVNHIISGVLRRKTSLGLIMCDLDYFKQVNDKYGHDVGDLVLKETASMISKGVREADIVIRFGGEEFFVLLIDVEPTQTMQVAEKIRVIFEEATIKIPNGTIRKTLSLGVSEFPNDADGFWQCIKYADVALYKAKETGRNRVVRFAEEMWSGDQF